MLTQFFLRPPLGSDLGGHCYVLFLDLDQCLGPQSYLPRRGHDTVCRTLCETIAQQEGFGDGNAVLSTSVDRNNRRLNA